MSDPNTLTEAVADLRRWADGYQQSRDHYQQIRPFVKAGAKDSDDANYDVPSFSRGPQDAMAAVALSYDGWLSALLQEFRYTLGTSETDTNVLLTKLREYMVRNSIEVKSRKTVHGAAAAGGSNVGNQVLYRCSKMADDVVNEAATIETLTFRCKRQAQNRSQLGLEIYDVTGAGRGDRSEFDGPGAGIQDTVLQAVGPGRSAYLLNPSFDLPFNGSGTDKMQFWDFVSGQANVARVTTSTLIAQDRGGSHASLEVTGTFKVRFDFRKNGIFLTRNLPFIGGLRYKFDSTAGTFVIRVGTASGVYTLSTSYADTNWHEATLDPDTKNAWADTFDTDSQPFFEIECTVAPSGGNAKLYLDDAFFEPMKQIGGRYVAIVSGRTVAVKGDYHTQACTLTCGVGSVQITGGGSGSIDTLMAGGVTLLPEAIPYNTSIAQTVQDAVDAINANQPTYPEYVATRTGGGNDTITITQVVPVEGTIAIVSTTTTLTKTDTDITGASIGLIQDCIVRRTGLQLRHASSATSGWDD